MILSLDKYEKYKNDKKVKKILSDRQKKIDKHKVLLLEKQKKRIEKSNNEIILSTEKKLVKFERKQQAILENQVRKVLGKKVLKKNPTVAKIKQKAFTEFQKYCRLSRADGDGFVVLIDTGKKAKFNECDGGHLFPKKNYPQLAFDEDNCRPISKWGNKKQMDNIGDWIDRLEFRIGRKRIDRLKEISEDKILKNVAYDSIYYQEKYDYYSMQNKKLLDKLEINQ